MSKIEVALCGWDLKSEEEGLLDRIGNKLLSMHSNIASFHIINTKIVGPPKTDIFIAFGQIAYIFSDI